MSLNEFLKEHRKVEEQSNQITKIPAKDVGSAYKPDFTRERRIYFRSLEPNGLRPYPEWPVWLLLSLEVIEPIGFAMFLIGNASDLRNRF